MAHWNPYYSGPNQNNTYYSDPNSQLYNNLQYGATYQQYDGYYLQNATNYIPNTPATIRTAREIEAEQLLYAQSQQNVRPVNATQKDTINRQNEGSSSQTVVVGSHNEGASSQTVLTSNLTATAAEFKPSTSSNTPLTVKTQTFSNNNYKQFERNYKKDYVDSKDTVKNESEPRPSTSSETSNIPSKNKGNFLKFSNKKSYERYDNAQNNVCDKYNKSRDKDRYKSSKNTREDVETVDNNRTKVSNGSGRFPNRDYQRDSYYSSKNSRFSRNSDDAYSRHNYDTNDRYSSEYSYNSERNKTANFRNPKNSYRNNYKDEVKYENWRSKTPSMSKDKNDKKFKDEQYSLKPRVEKNSTKEKSPETEIDDISQRDRLIEQVNKGTLECLVCCEFVRQVDKVWSCQKCYHIFHLRCALKWAKTSKDDNGWRCPACQHVCSSLPSDYICYCGRVTEPGYRLGDTAHSCGSICSRMGVRQGCPHHCRLLCHPGPCPTCQDLISKSCNCGKTKQMVKCSANVPLLCKAVCEKQLNCGVHFCTKICHPNDCDTCEETINQECFCGKSKKSVPCTEDQVGIVYYSCDAVCDRMLACGNHKCQDICHPGECAPCVRSVEQVKSCPCGKTELSVKRISCLDPIPCCDKICGKQFNCGPPGHRHTCQNVCHEGACPVCPLSSHVLCRCGHMSKEIECKKLVSRTDDARCEKRCTKKRSCAKHKCNQLCCIDVDHVCPLPCNRTLSCGQHRCEQTCHKGRCLPCWRTSFEELYCECGASVIYPPVPCGTKRPACTKPCTRAHGCEHTALHTCHSQPDCPPCTILTTKWCYGHHEKRSTIPCHQKEFSCGLPCGRELPCGRHKCQTPCHKGECLRETQYCTQTCTVPRETCGHSCGLPCHAPPCPESPCKETVKVTCECGLRSSTRACIDMVGEYQRIANSMLASKMSDMQLGHSIDIADVLKTTRKQVLRTLECNDECRLIERNRRLAIGLQIRNPDLSAKLTPRYSDFMRQWAKKDARFCQMIHEKLTELVQLAKQSKQKSRSYSFESMNRDKRHFIHEYCEHFGCESAAYDQEPNRNVVATAVKDKAWLPSVSILELLQRESGQRKVPGPILNRPLGQGKPSTSQSVSLKISAPSTSRGTFSSTLQRPKTPEGEMIDYFDYNPTKNNK